MIILQHAVLDIRTPSLDEIEMWFSQVDPEKQARLKSLRREEDRVRSICADHLARTMLAPHCALPPERIRFRRGENGKPFVQDFDVFYNVSHSGNFAACAVHCSPVGIDIEALRSIRPELIRRVCSPEELEFVREDSQRFLSVWTAKEAYLKFTGEGIATDLRRIVVVREGALCKTVQGIPLHHWLAEEYALSIVCQ